MTVAALAAPIPNAASNVIPLGLAAAMLWGISDFLGGLAARRSSALITVTVAHGSSMAMLVLVAIVFHAHAASERTLMWGLITGLCGGAAVIVFYRALALGEMGLTAALTGLLTALVPVIVSWLTEGRPSSTQLLGFVIAAVAICLISYEPHGRPHARGLGMAVIAGLGFGAFLVASKFASQGAVLWPLAWSRLVSASLAAGALLAVRIRIRRNALTAGQTHAISMGPWTAVLLLAGGAGILEAVGNLSYMLATLAGRLDVSAVLSSLYPAATILLALWLLKERTTHRKALGMVLALIAVVVISL